MVRRAATSQSGFFSNPLTANVFTAEERALVKNYQYRGSDASLLKKYVLDYIYDVVTPLYPMWLAPNVITVAGGICMTLATAIILYFSPNMDSTTVPAPAFFCSAFLVFVYQTLDNTDGRQARRTRASSPVGDLVDHGVDALCLSMGALQVALTLSLGRTYMTLVTICIGWLTFYAATWEQYFVGALHLGPINGAMEGIFAVAAAQVGAAVFTQEAYQSVLPALLFPLALGLPAAPMGNIINTVTAIRSEKRKNARSGSSQFPPDVHRFRTALKYFIPLVTQMAALLLAPHWQPEIFKGPSVYFIMYVATAFVGFAYSCSKLTLAHLIHAPYRLFFKTHLPMWGLVLNAFASAHGMPHLDAQTAIVIALVLSSIGYCYTVATVMWELTSILGIHVFSLKRSKAY